MRLVIVIFAGLALLVSATGAAQQSAAGRGVEDIDVARSLRLSRVAPSEYCAAARTGFPGSTFEDRYDFKAVASRAADGLVTNAAGPTVGHLHACFGATSDPLVVNFYAEGDLNGVRWTGRGDCRSAGREVPEPGITPWRCYLDLTALPAGFVGGQLTTNTIISRVASGPVSDPVGYTQPSIATVRLWRKR